MSLKNATTILCNRCKNKVYIREHDLKVNCKCMGLRNVRTELCGNYDAKPYVIKQKKTDLLGWCDKNGY